MDEFMVIQHAVEKFLGLVRSTKTDCIVSNESIEIDKRNEMCNDFFIETE